MIKYRHPVEKQGKRPLSPKEVVVVMSPEQRESCKTILNPESLPPVFGYDQEILWEDLKEVCRLGGKKSNIPKLFESSDGSWPPRTLLAQIECSACKELNSFGISKTELLKVISELWDHLSSNKPRTHKCDRCLYEKDLERRNLERQADKRKKEAEENMAALLDPNIYWPNDWPIQKRIDLLYDSAAYMYSYDIADRIKSLPYSDFLKTPYWKAIASKKRIEQGQRCGICNSDGILSVHHRSYSLHGYEHTKDGLRDLIALCETCHSTHHGKLAQL